MNTEKRGLFLSPFEPYVADKIPKKIGFANILKLLAEALILVKSIRDKRQYFRQ